MKRTKKITMEEYGSNESFNKKQDIQDLVNRESTQKWGISTHNSVNLPKYKKCDGIKANAGWYNFLKSSIYQLRP